MRVGWFVGNLRPPTLTHNSRPPGFATETTEAGIKGHIRWSRYGIEPSLLLMFDNHLRELSYVYIRSFSDFGYLLYTYYLYLYYATSRKILNRTFPSQLSFLYIYMDGYSLVNKYNV